MSTAGLEYKHHNGRGIAWPPAKTIYALAGLRTRRGPPIPTSA